MSSLNKASTVAVILLLLVSGVFGCAEEQLDTPDAAAEDFIQLINARKLGEAYDSLSVTSPLKNATRQEFITEMEKTFGDMPASFRFSDFHATEVIIDGDNAIVTWTATEVTGVSGKKGEAVETRASTIFENGDWKVVEPWNSQ